MKEFIEEFLRGVVAILCGFLVVKFLSDTTLKNTELQSELGISQGRFDGGYVEPVKTANSYSFDIDEEVSICINEDYAPEEHSHAEYKDGTDLSSYIVVQDVPETDKPGTFDIDYILVFEGENVKKTQTLRIEDNSTNGSCSAYHETSGTHACTFSWECDEDEKCLPDEGGIKRCTVVDETPVPETT